jgi:protein farnesyltransferase/geranylgeranyltransferase type-1 subunit alpha
LTYEVISLAAGNYSAWHYRRVLLDELKIPLEKEMELLRKIGLNMEKNYQIWHHRRCIAEVLNNKEILKLEKPYLREIFQSDSKNYHAWSYRVWLIERFQMWEGEMEDIERLLD